jgi:hypothetical protein
VQFTSTKGYDEAVKKECRIYKRYTSLQKPKSEEGIYYTSNEKGLLMSI